MSCSYYTWKSGYYCLKKEADVDEDMYYKYCRNYDYADCPRYKDSGSSGCYVTSACVEAMGLPDDCEELTTLRKLRDEWLKEQPGGKEKTKEYYRVAPGIVQAIEAKEDRKQVFQSIYDEMVCPCVKAIQEGKFQEACDLYERITRELEAKYKSEESNQS